MDSDSSGWIQRVMSPNRPGGASGRASLPVMAHHSGQAAPLSIVSAGGDALRQQMQTATSSLPIIVPSVSRQRMSPGTRSWLLCPVCGDAIIGPSGLKWIVRRAHTSTLWGKGNGLRPRNCLCRVHRRLPMESSSTTSSPSG